MPSEFTSPFQPPKINLVPAIPEFCISESIEATTTSPSS